MPRARKKKAPPASAFDFTGDEALAAERAFQARDSVRTGKISVFSIAHPSLARRRSYPPDAATLRVADAPHARASRVKKRVTGAAREVAKAARRAGGRSKRGEAEDGDGPAAGGRRGEARSGEAVLDAPGDEGGKTPSRTTRRGRKTAGSGGRQKKRMSDTLASPPDSAQSTWRRSSRKRVRSFKLRANDSEDDAEQVPDVQEIDTDPNSNEASQPMQKGNRRESSTSLPASVPTLENQRGITESTGKSVDAEGEVVEKGSGETAGTTPERQEAIAEESCDGNDSLAEQDRPLGSERTEASRLLRNTTEAEGEMQDGANDSVDVCKSLPETSVSNESGTDRDTIGSPSTRPKLQGLQSSTTGGSGKAASPRRELVQKRPRSLKFKAEPSGNDRDLHEVLNQTTTESAEPVSHMPQKAEMAADAIPKAADGERNSSIADTESVAPADSGSKAAVESIHTSQEPDKSGDRDPDDTIQNHIDVAIADVGGGFEPVKAATEKPAVDMSTGTLDSTKKVSSFESPVTPQPDISEIRVETKGDLHVTNFGEQLQTATLPRDGLHVGQIRKETDAKEETRPTPKRVRFCEPPPPVRSAEKKMGFSGIVKMRRRRERKHRMTMGDPDDVSVASASGKGPDEKARQVLLDELQYLLDGIFKKSNSGSKKAQGTETQVVVQALQALVKLLLRKPRPPRNAEEEGQDPECGILLQILAEQPVLLKTIVKRLCTVLGQSRVSDALLSLVFVLIFRSTPKILLVEEGEVDTLLNAFFRNGAASLKEDELPGQKKGSTKEGSKGQPLSRRRGRLGRLFDQMKPGGDTLNRLNDLIKQSGEADNEFAGFKNGMEACVHLLGVALSQILATQRETREWMRNNRRLDKIVAVLYSCEKVMLPKESDEVGETEMYLDGREGSGAWIGLVAAMRVLELATLDPVCQDRLARESRVGAIVVDVVRSIKTITDREFGTEWMVCAALRLCINLCHGCPAASRQFVAGGGDTSVLNCLAKECVSAGLLKKDVEEVEHQECEESFDVRVLCLAVLACIVDQEEEVCNRFETMHADGVKRRDRGAIALVLEILHIAEADTKKDDKDEKGDNDAEDMPPNRRRTAAQDSEAEKRSQFIMERKITVGYTCLLLGALVRRHKGNRGVVEELLPGKSLLGIAAVLAEFLEFHHEVGVISGSMNRMYASIIKSLVGPEPQVVGEEEGERVESEGEEGDSEEAHRVDLEVKETDGDGDHLMDMAGLDLQLEEMEAGDVEEIGTCEDIVSKEANEGEVAPGGMGSSE